MRTPRLLSLAAAVALATGTGVAQAAPSTPRAALTAVHLACTGDTVTGTLTARVAQPAPLRVELLADGRGGGGYGPTGRATTVAVTPGRTAYSYSFNVAGLPASVTKYRAVVTLGGASRSTNTVPVGQCAPGQEVPEAPAALLVPLTLASTGAGVLLLRRRQGAGALPA